MPTRQGGVLANRASTCPRDHFCRSTIAPRRSRPTTWNEFLPISIPITAITLLGSSAMGMLLSLNASCQLIADSAGARVAVGTEIALRPPHRSRRALLTHRALALDGDEEPLFGPRVEDAWIRQ